MKKDEFVDRGMSVHNVGMVLDYLNTGRMIEIDSRVFKLAATENGSARLMVSVDDDNWYGSNITLEEFVTLTNKLTEDDLTVMSANMALHSWNSRKTEERGRQFRADKGDTGG